MRDWIEIQKRRSGSEDLGLANSYSVLRSAHAQQGKFEEADKVSLRACELARELAGENSIELLYAVRSRAIVLEGQLHLAESETLLSGALADLDPAQEKTNWKLGRIASDLRRELASVISHQGRFQEAELLMRKELEAFKHDDPLGLEYRSSLLNDLGVILGLQGRLQEAEALYRESAQSGWDGNE